MANRFKKGFGLVRLLIIIAAIVVVVAVVLNFLKSNKVRQRDQQRISDLIKIQNALELYIRQNPDKGYPLSLTPLVLAGLLENVPQNPGVGPSCNNITGGYCYVPLGDDSRCASYHLGVLLERKGNSLLQKDADAGKAKVCLDFGLDFEGNSSDCGDRQDGLDRCFDIRP